MGKMGVRERGNIIGYGSWIAVTLLSLFVSMCFLSCNVDDPADGQQDISGNSLEVQFYYLNKEENALVSQSYTMEQEEQSGQIQELLAKMQEVPESIDVKAPMRFGFQVLSYQLEGTQVVIKVDEAYKQMLPSTEILVRAAIVRTLTQVKGIDGISFLVGEDPLTDHAGKPVGVLTADMFIDNEGSEINAYEQTNIKIYFANETGTALTEVNRLVVYNSNIAIERVIVDQLIAGPSNTESYPTVNPTTKVNSVTITDGICYVNLDSGFLTQPYNVTAEVTIYSIVNSLAELSNVNKVQLMINGETAVQYRDNISFENTFTRNLDLIE
ncbi:MAG: GerMN domain-containing protein [Lachnospiraceae bacterium]|nr:GerMN domain-containing protein [Lachnospiraceae bacterium]